MHFQREIQRLNVKRLSYSTFIRSPKQIQNIYRSYSHKLSLNELAFNDLGIRSLCYYPQFNSGRPLFDFSCAHMCFSACSDHISHLNLQSLKKNSPPHQNLQTLQMIFYFFILILRNSPTEYELKR